MNPCSICHIDPTSHSFNKITSANPNINLFYSCPAKATKYFESPGVIDHFKIHLENNKNNSWAYIIDCDGFTLRHAIEIKTTLALVDIMTNDYRESLKKVWIINLTWPMRLVLRTMWPILTTHLRSIVETSDKTLEQIQTITFL